jgi:hypothetical protein
VDTNGDQIALPLQYPRILKAHEVFDPGIEISNSMVDRRDNIVALLMLAKASADKSDGKWLAQASTSSRLSQSGRWSDRLRDMQKVQHR